MKVKAVEKLLKFDKNSAGVYRYVMSPEMYSSLERNKQKKGSSFARGLYYLHKEVHALFIQMVAGVSAIDAMIAIGIYQLTEILAFLHQRFGIFCGIAEMHIIIGQSVTYK